MRVSGGGDSGGIRAVGMGVKKIKWSGEWFGIRCARRTHSIVSLLILVAQVLMYIWSPYVGDMRCGVIVIGFTDHAGLGLELRLRCASRTRTTATSLFFVIGFGPSFFLVPMAVPLL